MIGYSSIPPSAPLLPAVVPLPNEMREYQHSVRQFLAAQGFDEVYNYSFLSEEALPAFGLNPDDHVRVLNPIAAGQNLMRATLVPGITRNIIDNSRFFDSFRLFELGVETHKRADSLPEEVNHLIAAIYAKDANAEGLFELKRVAESLVKDIEIRPAEEARPFEHPARSANIHLGDRVIGTLFEMHPSVVERGRAAILDLDLDVVLLLGRRETKYKPLQRFPSSAFDLSIICNEHTLVGNLQRELLVLAGEQLERIDFVRQYSGPPLAEGNKSVSFRVTVAAPDRTFSSEEVGAIRSRIIEGMRTLGYELRV